MHQAKELHTSWFTCTSLEDVAASHTTNVLLAPPLRQVVLFGMSHERPHAGGEGSFTYLSAGWPLLRSACKKNLQESFDTLSGDVKSQFGFVGPRLYKTAK